MSIPEVMIGDMPVWVLRPEPGNRATCARLTERGITPVPLPLFMVQPVAWDVPDASDFDALLLTSSNAVRHAGEGLTLLSTLPTYAVGESTAEAARTAGLSVAAVGDGGIAEMAERLAKDGRTKVLHLTGHDFTAPPDGFAPTVRIVYTACEGAEGDVLPALIAAPRPAHVLLHSARAARRFAALVKAAGLRQSDLHLHTLSPNIADAAGGGWGGITIAQSPNGAALLSTLQNWC